MIAMMVEFADDEVGTEDVAIANIFMFLSHGGSGGKWINLRLREGSTEKFWWEIHRDF